MSRERHILIVDDDRELVKGLSIRLRAAGYVVTSAPDVAQGLRGATAFPPDIIILDIRMPGASGLDFLAQYRNEREGRVIPVIVLSANVVEHARDKALALGASRFMQKPYQAHELLGAVYELLAEKESDSPTKPVRATPENELNACSTGDGRRLPLGADAIGEGTRQCRTIVC
ncbi:MAG: response regulator [Phycisphaerales bacterium]|nr:response regulator [Phycisphaerales bacterium]